MITACSASKYLSSEEDSFSIAALWRPCRSYPPCRSIGRFTVRCVLSWRVETEDGWGGTRPTKQTSPALGLIEPSKDPRADFFAHVIRGPFLYCPKKKR